MHMYAGTSRLFSAYVRRDFPFVQCICTPGLPVCSVHMYAGTSRLFSAYVRRDFPFVQCICTQGLPVCSVHMYAGTSHLFSAYVRRDFPFVQCICTQGLPVCSNIEERQRNPYSSGQTKKHTPLSIVIIENAFGRLKCRFRRIRDIQNVNLEMTMRLVIAACTLHNMLTEDLFE